MARYAPEARSADYDAAQLDRELYAVAEGLQFPDVTGAVFERMYALPNDPQDGWVMYFDSSIGGVITSTGLWRYDGTTWNLVG